MKYRLGVRTQSNVGFFRSILFENDEAPYCLVFGSTREQCDERAARVLRLLNLDDPLGKPQ